MKAESTHIALQDLMSRKETLTVSDFMSLFPDDPAPTVYSRIRSLTESGKIIPIGKGLYTSTHKPPYRPVISPWMKEIHKMLVGGCEGISHCITERDGNLFIYAAKEDIPSIRAGLMHWDGKVITESQLKHFPGELEGFIVLAKLVSDSPILLEEGITVPSIEKDLVDRICDRRRKPDFLAIQKLMEVYPVNKNRLNRFAARRGVDKQVSAVLDGLDRNRIRMIDRVQRKLASLPVTKAWVFGSFARGEETPESDLDLLVDYDKTAGISLLDVVRYKLDLENAIGRDVDLIENGSLKPFAVPSAEREKYLVYER